MIFSCVYISVTSHFIYVRTSSMFFSCVCCGIATGPLGRLTVNITDRNRSCSTSGTEDPSRLTRYKLNLHHACVNDLSKTLRPVSFPPSHAFLLPSSSICPSSTVPCSNSISPTLFSHLSVQRWNVIVDVCLRSCVRALAQDSCVSVGQRRCHGFDRSVFACTSFPVTYDDPWCNGLSTGEEEASMREGRWLLVGIMWPCESDVRGDAGKQ